MKALISISIFSLFVLSSCSIFNKNKYTSDLTGSTWNIKASGREYTITFKLGGVLASTHPNDVTPDNDTWEQNGANVTFYFNDKYATYKGKFVAKDKIEGTAKNKEKTWPFWLWKD